MNYKKQQILAELHQLARASIQGTVNSPTITEMAFKLFVTLAVLGVANAVLLPTLVKKVELEAPAEYQFSYSVHDEHTGDIKSQQEERHGDDVKGQYTLIDADGHRRVVDYTADEHNGFNAVVRREPLTGHKLVKTVVPVAKVAVPVAHYVAPTLKLAVPVAKYAVPVTKVVAPAHVATVSFSAPSLAYHY
ncbi:larval cuticle protein A2B-like [Anopheles funestus]|uniref:larval cuticle protein A2B-like n=1 Tax=Anopheles funestus TaxID=62324 RepID=UPI0020C6B991|nr:larval cuticle protein A2B-like [Anopheles funestus]